jgi:hypothetical protein
MSHFLNALINGPAHYTQSHHLSSIWTIVVVLAALAGEMLAVFLVVLSIFKIIQNFRQTIGWILRKRGIGKPQAELTFLELTFPSNTTKSAFATEQLHVLLRGGNTYPSIWHKLAGHKKLHSLELVSSRDDGIRYVMTVPADELDFIQHNLMAFLPGLKIAVIKDYLTAIKDGKIGVVELHLAADFVLPLQDHKAIKEHDPISFLMSHMTKLSPNELIACQIVATPVLNNTHPSVIRRVRKIQQAISMGEALSPQLIRRFPGIPRALLLVLLAPVWLFVMLVKLLISIPVAIFDPSSPNIPILEHGIKPKKKSTDPYEKELGMLVKTKLDQQLFEVSIRLLVSAQDEAVIQARLEALLASFQSFTSTNQSIRAQKELPFLRERTAKEDLPRFRARHLSPHLLTKVTIVSSSELSDLYHFPNTDLTKTEGLVKSRSQELPMPLSLKHSATKLDVIVGMNTHGGEESPIGMTLEQRQKHTYVIGKTGTGKTTLLTSSIYQDMVNGKGLAVLDPHGDMFQELLAIVPERRQKDVVVFDPSDRDYPVGLNILDPGIEFANEDDKQEWITSTVLSVFAKLTEKSQWGSRMEHILRNATMTALQLPNPSLYTLQRLLTDRKYQRDVANSLKDPVLKQFWLKEFAMLGSMQMSSAVAPLTHRLGHFITTKMSRHILLQQILLVNLSKGDIGEDQSAFFGIILTSFIWMAAYQRTKIPEKERRDFFVYVDEFQNFATSQFSEITSEGRKFHVSLIVSHQNIAQIEDTGILKIVAGNADTIISLKASPADEAFILPFMKPVVEKGDITNLAPYHFFMKVTTGDSEDAFSGQTVPLDEEQSEATKQAVLAYSRDQYTTPKAKVEAYMEDLFAQPKEQKKPPADGDKSKESGL